MWQLVMIKWCGKFFVIPVQVKHIVRTVQAMMIVVGACLCVQSCQPLPPALPKTPSFVLGAPDSGRVASLAEAVQAKVGARHDGLLAITGNKQALDYRLAIIDNATQSVDVRMFFWMQDQAGRVLLERVLLAADRGVRVRLLLDDLVLGLTHSDKQLAAINTHPNVQVRIYNPFHRRGGLLSRSFQMISNPKEKNQRMHNKTIIVDHSLAILSGRNIGSHCFGYGKRYNLVDLGVIVSGPVIDQIGKGFDRYWNSEPSYDVAAFYPQMDRSALDRFREKSLASIRKRNHRSGRTIPNGKQDGIRVLTRLAQEMRKGRARYVEDDPAVPSASRAVIKDAVALARNSRHDLILVTPYIVPDTGLMDMIAAVRKRGVRVRLLVPSIGSNNHPIVHSQYQKYRKPLLDLGVEVYEFRHRPAPSALKYVNEGPKATRKVGLHAKSVVVDGRFSYIGTLNFDGRAIFVNTEEGLLIDSVPLTRDLRQMMEVLMLPENAWRIHIDQHGDILWVAGNETRRREPTLNVFQAALEILLRRLNYNTPTFPDQQIYRNLP